MIPSTRTRRQERAPTGRGSRLDRAHGTLARAGDHSWALLSSALAVVGLVVLLRAGRYSERWPLLALAAPALSIIVSRRQRGLWRARRDAWIEACRRFAAGAGPIPWSAAVALVGVPFVVVDLAHGRWLGAIDTRPVIPTAVSLVRDGDWDVRELAHARGGNLLAAPDGTLLKCFQTNGARVHSSFPQGMTPFALGVVAPARWLGADLESRPVQLRLEKLAAALIAACTLVLFFLTALRIGSTRAAAVATALLATGSGILTTIGLALWQHGGVTIWLLAALLVEFSSDGRPGWRGTLVQGVALGSMVACRPTAALLVGLFGLWAAWRSPRRALALGWIAALAFAPWLGLNLALYGNLLGPACVNANAGSQNWDFFRPATIAGVLIGPARGLFVYQPWALLAFGLAVPAIRARAALRPGPAGWVAFAAVASTAHIYVIGSWRDWSGGYCWGSRLLTDILPLLGLLCVPTIEALLRTGRGIAFVLLLALLAAATQWPAILAGAGQWNFVTDHAADLWSWSNAPFLYRAASPW